MAVKNCLFCKIYEDGTGIEYRDDFFYMRFDRFPVSPGHLEIVAIRHVEASIHLTAKEALSFHNMKKLAIDLIEIANLEVIYEEMLQNPVDESSAKFLKNALQSPYINKIPNGHTFGENGGEAAGRTIHHFHYHIIPRFFGDVGDPRGGIRNIIPGMGGY